LFQLARHFERLFCAGKKEWSIVDPTMATKVEGEGKARPDTNERWGKRTSHHIGSDRQTWGRLLFAIRVDMALFIGSPISRCGENISQWKGEEIHPEILVFSKEAPS